MLPSSAAAVMFDTLVRFIREPLRTLLVVGLVVAVGAFFYRAVTAVRPDPCRMIYAWPTWRPY